jgi:hypothetical protein
MENDLQSEEVKILIKDLISALAEFSEISSHTPLKSFNQRNLFNPTMNFGFIELNSSPDFRPVYDKAFKLSQKALELKLINEIPDSLSRIRF